MIYQLYKGPSLLNGKPIVVLATGINSPSTNVKTGPMVQVWIFSDEMNPLEAWKQGIDESVCGTCVHRGQWNGTRMHGRTCYVALHQAPYQIYKYYQEHKSKVLEPEHLWKKQVRLGAYGEITAAPFDVIEPLLHYVEMTTGYTHQWRSCDKRWQSRLMASCESLDEYRQAIEQGWRTYRVMETDDTTEEEEILCPGSHEGGRRLTCNQCGYCDGNTGKHSRNVAVYRHGIFAALPVLKVV